MPYLLFNGALNQTFLGLQAYIWIMLALFIMAVGTYVVWYFFFWAPLKPVHGHFVSHINGSNSALAFNEHLNFVMKSEKKAKLIFDETVKEAKEGEKDWEVAPSGLIGRVLNDLIFDGGNWTDVNSSVREHIERYAAIYNETNPDDEIHTLGKFYKCLCENKMGPCPEVKRNFRVDWKRIDFAIPPDHVQTQWDGYLGQLAKRMNEIENADVSMYGYIILGLSAMICIGMLVIKFIK
jgi:hypothetical protein